MYESLVSRLQLNLQRIEVARHHVPEVSSSGQFQEVLLAKQGLHLFEEIVINMSLQGQIVCVAQDQFFFVSKEWARLICSNCVDLCRGQSYGFGNLTLSAAA